MNLLIFDNIFIFAYFIWYISFNWWWCFQKLAVCLCKM